jgi:hypothetical protein
MVQMAAVGGHLEAMLLLAEAGVAWRGSRGMSSQKDAASLYAIKVPGCRVSECPNYLKCDFFLTTCDDAAAAAASIPQQVAAGSLVLF